MKKKMNFETAIEALEDIVSELESENLPLEEALKAYTRSQELIQTCQSQLQKAEAQIAQTQPVSAVKELKKTNGSEEAEFELDDFASD